MRFLKIIFLVILGVISLAACNYLVVIEPTSNPGADLTLDSVRTEAVETVEFELTEKATYSSFTGTPPTQQSTLTLTQTITAIPATTSPSTTSTEQLNTPTAIDTATQLPPTATRTSMPTPTVVTEKAQISFLGVEKDRAVRVLATHFPADQVFTIRVGPFHDFAVNHVTVGTIYSGDGGSFEFTILLPTETLFAEMITVRLDSPQNSYAYNAFKNQTSGNVIYGDLLIENTLCDVVVSPDSEKSVEPLENFDVVWSVRNLSDQTWDVNQVDYKWLSGVEIQLYSKLYDLPQTVEPDETINIIVDVRAPETVGVYTTQWAIVSGRTILCHLPLTVNVEEAED